MIGYPIIDSEELRAKLRGVIRTLGVSQNAVARRMGITNGHLSRVLSGEKEPGDKVASWLGYEVITRYQRSRS